MRLLTLTVIIILSITNLSIAASQNVYVILDTNIVKEGGVVKLKLGSEQPVEAAGVEFLGKKYPVFFKTFDKFEKEFVYHSIIPVPLDVTGKEKLIIKYRLTNGEHKQTEWITIKNIKSPETTVDTGGQVNALMKDLRKENVIIKKKQKKTTAAKYDFPFIKPLENRITGGFGDKRVYDDGTVGWRHKGLDISGRPTKTIKATNHGDVVMANSTKGHGNMVIIDHGGGIYSLYYHMDKVFVRTGGKAKKGDVIGTVGSTGIATGPHLHWQMNVFKVPVNPYSFLVEFK